MDSWLSVCNRNFGNVPRNFGWFEFHTYLKIPKPMWCEKDFFGQKNLVSFFKTQKNIIRNGVLVWGTVIQANALLFKHGWFNHPGEVVYCPDASREVDLEALYEVAFRLGQLKNTKPKEPELSYIADYLTNEFMRVFGHPVPRCMSPKMDCCISTVLFARKHLPNKRLSGTFFPLILNPNDPKVAMVLPSRYWPDELVSAWINE